MGEPFWLGSPLFADELVGRESLEGLEPAAEVVGVDEVLEVPPQLIMAIVVEALDGRVLDGAVHALDLSVCPRMIDFREPVLDAVLVADPVEDGVEGVFVTGLVGELDSVVGQHRVDGVGNCGDEIAQELGRRHLARLLMEFGISKLGCPVDPNEQAQLAFCCLNLGDVDVEEADRISFELLADRLVAFDLRQAPDPMPLQAAMQRGPCQMRNCRLEGIQAIIERQERMLAEGDDDRFLLHRKHGRARFLRARPQVRD